VLIAHPVDRSKIDPTASFAQPCVISAATIGARTMVWQFASVIRGARIGADCSIGAGAMIDGVHIGDRCLIGTNAVIGGYFEIGNDVFIGPNVAFSNDRWPSTDKDGFDLEWLRENASIRVHDFASIGANAVILPGVTIGAHVLIAAGAVVTHSVRPGMLYCRDGTIKPKPEGWQRMRMKAAA
jgi:UDP-2-acetamido-3-amino-2,3-dideoxy-glucuronate N-acetyltransferase